MKKINQYLIEKLKLDSSLLKAQSTYKHNWKVQTFDVPETTEDFVIDGNSVWKTMKLPLTAYVVYNDKYHGDRPHFADTEDFIIAMMYNQQDFEDFTPEDDILYASDDLQEILEWMFDKYNVPYPPEDEDEFDVWVEKYEDDFIPIDNLQVLGEVYLDRDRWYNGAKSFKDYNKDFYRTVEGASCFSVER